jgi:hypothetical protein
MPHCAKPRTDDPRYFPENVEGKVQTCRVCGKQKALTLFTKGSQTKSGYITMCLACNNERSNRYKRDNKDRVRGSRKKWLDKNREYFNAYMRNRKKPEPDFVPMGHTTKYTLEEANQWQRDYYHKNGDKIRDYRNERNQRPDVKRKRADYAAKRLETDLGQLIKTKLRGRVYSAVRGTDKSARTMELLGCSIEFFIHWLETQFTNGMSWENYGTWKVGEPMKWHIDHIRPCASFDLTDPAQQRECFHWSNMQPLWAKDNYEKGDKVLPASDYQI